jgi:hypothetical protein
MDKNMKAEIFGEQLKESFMFLVVLMVKWKQ